MSPIRPRTSEPAKVLISAGSETIGVKLLQAISFQKLSLRRGSSRPAVENDSSCPILSIPPVARDDLVIAHNQSRKRSEEHTSELQSQSNLVCRLLLEKEIIN